MKSEWEQQKTWADLEAQVCLAVQLLEISDQRGNASPWMLTNSQAVVFLFDNCESLKLKLSLSEEVETLQRRHIFLLIKFIEVFFILNLESFNPEQTEEVYRTILLVNWI